MNSLNDLIAADVLSRAAGSGEITLTTGTSEDGRTFYQATRDGGLCGRHYQQARRHPERSQFMPLSFMQILLAKFPLYDPAWSAGVQSAWFSTMAKMKGAGE